MNHKTLRISADLLMQFLKEPIPPGITQEGIPFDAVIEGAWFEPTGTIVLLIASHQFESDGGELNPLFHRNSA